jgi:hypothetical protein
MDTTLDTTADDTITTGSETVALWNPIAAALWSLLLSPALGAWLHMRNRERLGQPGQARRARYWFAGTFAISLAGYLLAAAAVLLEREDLVVAWWTGFAVFGIWVVFSAYPQISRIDDRHGEAYTRRSWAARLLIAFAANCAIPFVTGIIVGFRTAAAAAGA